MTSKMTQKELQAAIRDLFKDKPIADLYKRYRPKLFKEVIGQDPIINSLKRSIATGDIAGAYGFWGPPGCGKTTVGLILAKALNCENLSEDSEPCLECSSCVSIENETSFGFNYLSMANDGSVDRVRDIVNKAQMKQAVNKQVWILDEIHNLHEKAYDALLIPLEKKQEMTSFIFCSTDQHKIKDTVLQRVQSKVFRKVSPELLEVRCKEIISDLGVDPELEILKPVYAVAIAKGKGHVRKTLSELEQVLSSGDVSLETDNKLLSRVASLSIAGTLLEIKNLIDEEGQDFLDLARNLHEDLLAKLLTNSPKNSQWVATHFGSAENFVDFIAAHGEAVDKASFTLEQRLVYESYLMKALLKAKVQKSKIEQRASKAPRT